MSFISCRYVKYFRKCNVSSSLRLPHALDWQSSPESQHSEWHPAPRSAVLLHYPGPLGSGGAQDHRFLYLPGGLHLHPGWKQHDHIYGEMALFPPVLLICKPSQETCNNNIQYYL